MKWMIFGLMFVFLVSPVSADIGDEYCGGYGMMGYWGHSSFFGAIFWALLLVLMVLAIYWLVREIQKDSRPKRRKR